jgi:hypothetical protein
MRAAIVCASHAGNGGMYSVDLAAKRFFDALGIDYDLVIFQLPRPNLTFGELNYKLLRDADDLGGYSHIVYWGDFLNNPHYGWSDFSGRDVEFGYSSDRLEAFKRWRSIFALNGNNSGRRVVSVGNNFQNNFSNLPRQVTDGVFDDLFYSIDTFLPRDPFSMMNLARYFPTGDTFKIQAGLDCAFLLDDCAEKPNQFKHFSYFFHRSGFTKTENLVQELEKKSGLVGRPLTGWLNLTARSATPTFQNLREQMNSSRFVVSDTYHVCINSMCLGTPTFGIGRAANGQNGTLGDFKKWTLFEMINRVECYFQMGAESENDFFDDLISEIFAQLEEGEAQKQYTTGLKLQTRSFQKRLQRSLGL